MLWWIIGAFAIIFAYKLEKTLESIDNKLYDIQSYIEEMRGDDLDDDHKYQYELDKSVNGKE